MFSNEQLDILTKFESMKNKLRKQGKLGFDGPYAELYNPCSGVIPGKVYTIGAYSNVGKSKFAYSHVAYFLKANKKVLFINLEVDAEHCLMNIIQAVENMNYKEIMDFEFTDDNLKLYENLVITDNLFKLDDIEKKIMEEKADVVFIDFVQNIQSSGGGAYEQNATTAKGIQRVAIQSKSVIYSLSQLSNSVGRDVNNGNTDFVSLKGSGEYYASSDVIFLLQRLEDEMIVKIIKNKYGPNGKEFAFAVDFSRNQFTFKRSDDGLD